MNEMSTHEKNIIVLDAHKYYENGEQRDDIAASLQNSCDKSCHSLSNIVTPHCPPTHTQAEVFYKKNPKLLTQFQYSEKEAVPIVVIVGEEERARGGVKISDVCSRAEVSIEADFCVRLFKMVKYLIYKCLLAVFCVPLFENYKYLI